MSATCAVRRIARDLAGKVIRIGPNGTGTLLRRDPVSGRLTFFSPCGRFEEMIRRKAPTC